MADYYVREEDGTSKFILEDSSGDLLLEVQTSVATDFIASVATTYTPTVSAVGLAAPFIASVTAAYAPTLQLLDIFAPFIASVTVVYTPVFPGVGFNPISEDFLGNPAEYEQGFGQDFDDFTLEEVAPFDLLVLPLIASVTQVFYQQLPQRDLDFIASSTVVYAPNTNPLTFAAAGSFTFTPSAISHVYVQMWGGGGGGVGATGPDAGAAGGGGAYAENPQVPVTSGTPYTGTVGAGGTAGNTGHHSGGDGADSSFTGDSATTVLAKGGKGGDSTNHASNAPGGAASGSTGTTKHSGGQGGSGQTGGSGGGGGAAGSILGDGAGGTDGTTGATPGGVGAGGGGSGGNGGGPGNVGTDGHVPGGGGGANGQSTSGTAGAGAGGVVIISWGVTYPATISSVTALYTPTLLLVDVRPAFIASVTQVFAPNLNQFDLPFIASVTVVYAPSLPVVNVPFISSTTIVWGVWSVFDPNRVFGTSPGNGGEQFVTRLAPAGYSVVAILTATIGTGTGALTLAGDGGMPTDRAFQVTIDSEKIYVTPTGGGSYLMRARAMGNTAAATHTAGASVTWDDSYDMAVTATETISQDFTANITGSGSQTYPGWLIAYDSSQAYNAAGDRYPMHVTLFVGVFDAGTGVGGTNKTDGSQPNAICTPTGVSDDCPAALSNPARISGDIGIGDIAVVRYTNSEAYVVDLGPRSVAIQSWYGMKRVDTSDNDVTFTDPNGIVVDTSGAEGTYTGVINGEFTPPVLGPAISPYNGLPTPNDEPYTSVVMPHTNRHFTLTLERGWPIGVLAVRQGNRRVPFWQSWDWHNYGYVYDGFGRDCTYCQMVVNRNGIVFGSVPEVELPNSVDIDGPQAVWDDGSYYFGVSWYVCLFANAYLVLGPSIGGTTPTLDAGGFVPTVTFPGGVPVVNVPGDFPPPPPFVEGGSGGDISPPVNTGLHVWQTS